MDILISEDDLKQVVGREFDSIVNLARFNSFCLSCHGVKKIEMINYNLMLDNFNNVVFRGTCKSCNSKIARCIEIGEQPKFTLKIEGLRRIITHKN